MIPLGNSVAIQVDCVAIQAVCFECFFEKDTPRDLSLQIDKIKSILYTY